MLPLTVGAALRVADLDAHRDWLIDAQRDLEIQDFIFPDILDGDFSGLVSRALRSLDGFDGRLGIHGPFFDLPLDARDPAIREVIARRMLRGLDACAALGGSHMVIHSPFTTWDHNNLDNLPGARDSLIQRVHDTLAGIVRRAEDAGIVLVMENIEDVDPRARVRLADSFGSTAVRVSLDTGHAMYAHGATGAPPVDYFVRAAGDRLAHVHLQDADGFADRHWPIGDGAVNWPAVFRALADHAPDARLILELRDPTGIPKSMAHLSRLGLAR